MVKNHNLVIKKKNFCETEITNSRPWVEKDKDGNKIDHTDKLCKFSNNKCIYNETNIYDLNNYINGGKCCNLKTLDIDDWNNCNYDQ